jgi:hypothetical protein
MAKTVTIQAQQKWDYCSESRRTDTSLLIALNEQGQRGWELVNVLHHKDPKGETSWTAFLKRPSVGQAPAPVQASAGTSTTLLPSAQPLEPSAGPQGFDLSGDAFQLKTEEPSSAG